MFATLRFPSPRASHRRPVGAPLVSVVIVNYRQWTNTARLVRQLRRSCAMRQGFAEVVIVDNHSPPHPLRARLRRMSGVSLRCLRQNRGFARGANEGCRLSRGAWFLLLNPDVTVAPDFLDQVLQRLNTNLDARSSNLGIIGLRSFDADGSIQSSTGRDPTLLGTLLGQLRPRPIRKGPPLLGRHRRRVPWVTGCGLLVRRDCFTQLGGFDPGYFLYYEDADLCRRARTAGWEVWHEPMLSVVHHHPLHTRSVPPCVRLMTRHALLTYAHKHWHPWALLILLLITWGEALLRGWPMVRRMAWEFARGGPRRAYRRVWRIAQQRSRIGEQIEHPREAHRERVLLPC